MPHTTVASGTFPSREAADQAVQRLVSSGFARNSIELHRHDDDEGYDLDIHTRPENVGRAERLIYASSSPISAMSMRSMGDAAAGAVQAAKAHPLVLLGAGLLAGFVIYNLIPRSEPEPARQQGKGRSNRARR